MDPTRALFLWAVLKDPAGRDPSAQLRARISA